MTSSERQHHLPLSLKRCFIANQINSHSIGLPNERTVAQKIKRHISMQLENCHSNISFKQLKVRNCINSTLSLKIRSKISKTLISSYNNKIPVDGSKFKFSKIYKKMTSHHQQRFSLPHKNFIIRNELLRALFISIGYLIVAGPTQLLCALFHANRTRFNVCFYAV